VNGVVVVDTNVPIAASGRSEQASVECVAACREAILGIMNDERRLALDDDGLIITEYKQNLSASGQPGLGDAFLVWVLTNSANPERCDLVPLTEAAGAEGGFEQFPDAEGLEEFDQSDRKFVAVANAHAGKPPIFEALDSKWWGWKDALAAAGITVVFLCREEVEAAYERKFPAAAPAARPDIGRRPRRG
jgi:hypothetical protein